MENGKFEPEAEATKLTCGTRACGVAVQSTEQKRTAVGLLGGQVGVIAGEG